MAQAGQKDHEAPIRRFAMVVVTEAEDAAAAHDELSAHLTHDGRCVDVGAPCPLGPAQRYETTEIRLVVDGETAVTVPVSPRSRSLS